MIHFLDIHFMVRHIHFVQFMFEKLHKGWKSGKSSIVVRYYEYDADRDLWVRTTLDLYLQRTKPWRTDQKKQLSYVNTHKEVCSSTISVWIMKILNLAGIDTSVFKGHSSGSAASSGPKLAGATISFILTLIWVWWWWGLGGVILLPPPPQLVFP